MFEGWRQRVASGAILLALPAAWPVIPATSSHASGDRALGQYLSSECVTCHQLSGRFDGIPPIVGWPEETFVQIMNEYKSKTRNHPVMQTIAGRLSPEEIAALAAYFGSVAPAPVQREGGKS
ncbi:c-type cytochrome [Pseudorhodoplanes sp.]|uniref:c-type cytochrome n=1 Tax=Pseudorhodoplanes sp. TaxID=1934341 RepID=UPI002BA8B0A9|nr:c-type cytochrome [Pseudorhodoplanes sp.]HWV41930.1 c-type cytochrome [Pseudorhodoplanes sp.]